MSSPTVSTKLARIAEQSARNPEMVFTTLAHHLDVDFLRTQCLALGVNWVVDADVSGFFDNIDHGHLRDILKRKVNAGAIIRLIGKWLNAGVLEEGRLWTPEMGTPQGGVISPLLANIYLHTILDEWFRQEVQPRLGGECFLVRFADDFVIGCATRTDAERVFDVLPKRFSRFGLTIHPDKSRLVQFSRPCWKKGKCTGTFDFLGFTHYWGKTRKGGWTIKRKTRRNRLQRAMRSIWLWCRDSRHWKLPEQHQCLSAKLRGHYAYYGIRGNYKMLEVVFEYAENAWKYWLGRRSRDAYITWDDFDTKIREFFPLPRPRIVHAC